MPERIDQPPTDEEYEQQKHENRAWMLSQMQEALNEGLLIAEKVKSELDKGDLGEAIKTVRELTSTGRSVTSFGDRLEADLKIKIDNDEVNKNLKEKNEKNNP